MMEDGRKRKAMYDIAGESSEKRARSPAISDGGNEDIMAWLSVDEETMGELMELLDEEVMTSPAAVKVKFIDDPYSTPAIFQSSSSYVTINGNEESCGSSFSDSDSSVMASIDVGCVVINNRRRGGGGGGDSEAISGLPASENGSASGEDDEVARYFVVEEEEEEDGEGSVSEINGSDCFDWDDALLARFLASSLQNKFKNWQDLRRHKLTASTFGGAVGFWPGRRVQLWSEKIGAIEPFSGNIATIWKNIRVEEALIRYMQITRSTDVDPAGFQVYGKANSEDDWLAASPDGVVGALPSRGVLEIKCPYFNGDMAQASPYKRVPLHYIPQAQGLMEIMDMEWMHFYVWTVKGSSLFRIYRDRNYWDGLLKIALSDFWWSHVQPAWCSNIKSEIEIQLLKPGPKHKLCSEIVYASKRIVDNSELLNRQFHGKLENDKTDGSCYFY